MRWGEITEAFNDKFEGRILSGDPTPRPRRSKPSLTTERYRVPEILLITKFPPKSPAIAQAVAALKRARVERGLPPEVSDGGESDDEEEDGEEEEAEEVEEVEVEEVEEQEQVETSQPPSSRGTPHQGPRRGGFGGAGKGRGGGAGSTSKRGGSGK